MNARTPLLSRLLHETQSNGIGKTSREGERRPWSSWQVTGVDLQLSQRTPLKHSRKCTHLIICAAYGPHANRRTRQQLIAPNTCLNRPQAFVPPLPWGTHKTSPTLLTLFQGLYVVSKYKSFSYVGLRSYDGQPDTRACCQSYEP